MRKCLMFLVLSLIMLATSSCTPDNPPAVEGGQLQLAFEPVVGGAPLQLGNTSYTNVHGETFTVTAFNYYVTNLRLRRSDGGEYVVPQDSSYFLVRASDPATQLITLRHVPAGTYTGVSYLIGVDSLRNTAGIEKRTGVLDPAGGHTGGMYWDWNSGYIHLKLEGQSPQAPASTTGNPYVYHIGLFGGYRTRTLNNIRTVELSWPDTPLGVSEGVVPCLHIQADIQRIFDGPIPVRIAQTPLIMVSPLSAGVADNYARMFRVSGQSSKGQ